MIIWMHLGSGKMPRIPKEDSGRKGGGADIGKSRRERYEKRKISLGKRMKLSAHDPEARFIRRKGMKPDLYHKMHFGFDGSTGLVMSADAGHVSYKDPSGRFFYLDNGDALDDGSGYPSVCVVCDGFGSGGKLSMPLYGKMIMVTIHGYRYWRLD